MTHPNIEHHYSTQSLTKELMVVNKIVLDMNNRKMGRTCTNCLVRTLASDAASHQSNQPRYKTRLITLLFSEVAAINVMFTVSYVGFHLLACCWKPSGGVRMFKVDVRGVSVTTLCTDGQHRLHHHGPRKRREQHSAAAGLATALGHSLSLLSHSIAT